LALAENAGVDLDRMLLAGIYEKEASIAESSKSWDSVIAARDTLRPLVDRDNPPKEYLVAYIQLLLRQLERDQKQTDKSVENDERRKLLASDVALRIEKLDSALDANPTAEIRFLAVGFRVRLLVVQDHADEARKILDDFARGTLAEATKDSDRAKLLLQLGNLASEVGFQQEAEEWYRALLQIAPNSYVLLARSLSDQKKYSDAVDLCLRVAPKRPPGEIATLLTQLLTNAGNDKELEARIEPTITAALDKDRNNVDLLMSVAVRNVSAGRYEEAIKLFRRALELQPNNSLALNNLATLLAERPKDLVEARKYVEAAMAINGRSPPLLDTLATIEIHSGKHKQAAEDLEEAVAGAASDPRYYFHLAVAYQNSGRPVEAQSALATAEKRGLSGALLTSADNALLAELRRDQPAIAGEQK
jgi:tetratricopeptide (TPR) repeat protein